MLRFALSYVTKGWRYTSVISLTFCSPLNIVPTKHLDPKTTLRIEAFTMLANPIINVRGPA
jgi:hypothetical protein